MGSQLDPPDVVREDTTDPSITGRDEPTSPTGFRDEPTSPSAFGDDPTAPDVLREDSTAPVGVREQPTAPAGTHTVKLVPPWLATPDPPAREQPRDALFWPVVVFVAILVASIGIMLVRDSSRHTGSSPFVTSP